ncbi:hypothetical protein NKF06_02190 [Haloferax sp. AB510]|uniref:hypothetical protein n=1 Tax=Haloferax sp. AB510 TaxID=2934172 RepID=UPI00209BE4D4|nr:hypothetical protein [Haloferax sp. AB510]MCO8265423.1 hypothetical protein [Haloferax sp. AB510]
MGIDFVGGGNFDGKAKLEIQSTDSVGLDENYTNTVYGSFSKPGDGSLEYYSDIVDGNQWSGSVGDGGLDHCNMDGSLDRVEAETGKDTYFRVVERNAQW